jgi:hypothetical protein
MGGKSRQHRDSIPNRPARSQLVYRLSTQPTHKVIVSEIFGYKMSKGPILCNKKRVFFLLGDSPASECYVLTFQNTLSVAFTPPMKVEQSECCEMSAHKFLLLGIHPEERIQHEKSNYVDCLERGRETKL